MDIASLKRDLVTSPALVNESESDDSLSFTSCPIEEDDLFPPDKMPCRPIPQTYDWVKNLTLKNDEVAPVQCFRYVCFVCINLYSFKNSFEKNFMYRLLCPIVGMT